MAYTLKKDQVSNDEDYLERLFDIAVHEAGHAVIALVLGLIGGTVTIKPTPDALGTAKYSPVLIRPRRYYRPNAKSLARAGILVTLAGPVAALDLCGVRIDSRCNDDANSVYTEAKAAGIEHEVHRLTAYTRRLVMRHRDKIGRVADELYQRKSGTMSSYMVRRFTYHSRAEWRAMRRKLLAARRKRAASR
jgi:hypothetical protein